jgi:hypothetical protein
MKVYIILAVLSTMLIGTGLAQNATTTTTGDVNAFKQALEKDGFTVQQGSPGYLDLIKLRITNNQALRTCIGLSFPILSFSMPF